MQTEYGLEQKTVVEVSALTGMLSAFENVRKHIETYEAQINDKLKRIEQTETQGK